MMDYLKICNGGLIKSHPILCNLKSLQILAYYDKLEVCNPLGTHTKKHKLGIIIFTLGELKGTFICMISPSSIQNNYKLSVAAHLLATIS